MPARILPFDPHQSYGSGPGQLGAMPATPGDVSGLVSGGKSLVEWLGELLTAPNAGSSFPKVMRLTSLDPAADKAILNSTRDFTPYESTITELKKLLRSGELTQAGPATEGKSVEQLGKLLRRSLK